MVMASGGTLHTNVSTIIVVKGTNYLVCGNLCCSLFYYLKVYNPACCRMLAYRHIGTFLGF